MKIFLAIAYCLFSFSNLNAQDKVKLYGRVTDFRGNPMDSVSIRLKNKSFENLFETLSDKNGDFSMQVDKGNYFCIYAIKLSDYGKSKLEYWAWNIPINKDLEINPKYQRIEIYGINAFEPQVSPFETYNIFFRPMSLTKSLKINRINIKKGDTLNISPEKISPEEISIKINGVDSKIVSINKTIEYARGNFLYSYNIQILKPHKNFNLLNENEKIKGYNKITIILNSKETNESGMGEYYYKKNEYTE